MYRKNFFSLKLINSSLWDLPSPSSLSYYWNFGSSLGLCLIVQILTGLFLTFHYISYSPESFNSISLLMREVWFGWLIRFVHMNGASVFFFFIYLHLFRGIFFSSFLHKSVWISGVFIIFLLMAISFLGYVLPWGQMSYWAVAVITNLFSVVPLIGSELVEWIWGGFTVGTPTLIRFYSLHFLFPFVLLFFVLVHLYNLHKEGSSNPLGFNSNIDKVSFHPYFTLKDLFFYFFLLSVFSFFYFYFPYLLGDPVNNIPANFMQTPNHIQPEWYFLPYYAVLRSFSSKVGGVLGLIFSVLSFSFLIFFSYGFSSSFSFYRSFVFWLLIFNFLFLMTMGSLPAEDPFVFLSKVSSFFHFFFLLMINL